MQTLLTITALSGVLSACGRATDADTSRPRFEAHAVVSPGGQASTVAVAPSERYLNDGDAEKVDDGDGDNRGPDHEDHDGDSFEEYEATDDNLRYRDGDDGGVVAVGRTASPGERTGVAAVVRRYYSAAAADDGTRACALAAPAFAQALPEDYGRPPGPAYLRGKTCAAILARLFERYAKSLAAPVAVTGVRMVGGQALALLGSRTMPASSLSLTRERGVWRVSQMIGQPLP